MSIPNFLRKSNPPARAGEPGRGREVSAAETCRANGWDVGTRLVGDEGYGPSVIEITAVGERRILAKTVSSPHGPAPEGSWTLDCRNWQVTP